MHPSPFRRAPSPCGAGAVGLVNFCWGLDDVATGWRCNRWQPRAAPPPWGGSSAMLCPTPYHLCGASGLALAASCRVGSRPRAHPTAARGVGGAVARTPRGEVLFTFPTGNWLSRFMELAALVISRPPRGLSRWRRLRLSLRGAGRAALRLAHRCAKEPATPRLLRSYSLLTLD